MTDDSTAPTSTRSESDDTRRQVLATFRGAGSALSVDDVARALALHRNTVRFHARALVESGLLTQDTERTGGKGRPRAVYRPTVLGARSGERNFELLSTILIEHVAATAPEPTAAATAAGRAWGAQLSAAARPQPADERVFDFLADLGFEPVRPDPPDTSRLHLHNCPFRELVDAHQDIVCAVHRGLLEGLVTSAPAPPAADHAPPTVTLEPFTTPAHCTVAVIEPHP